MAPTPLSAATPLDAPSADSVAPGAVALSPRLYSADLAPTRAANRTWGRYSLFALWTNDVHNIANYSFAIGLFALGMSGAQILAAFALGALVIYGLMNLSGYMGQKTGLPYPVMCRISFGIHGAQVPALIRAVIAIAWFGIQTYLASVVLRVLLAAVAPGLRELDQDSILGLSTLGWITFLGIWSVQLVIFAYGMEMVRRYESFAGPVILVTFSALAFWMYQRSGFSITWSTGEGYSGSTMWLKVLGAAALWVSLYGTMILNFCDFTRNCPDRRTISVGNFWGLPVNMLGFAFIAVVLAGAQFSIDGKLVQSPTEIVASIPNTAGLVLACLAFLIVTVAVNIMANFVAPAYVLTNLAPKLLNFRRAGLLSATIAVLILPWHLYNSPAVILYFLGGLGALLGPMYGIIVTDYYLVRRGRVNLPELYSESRDAAYHYRRGVNLRAVAAFIPSALIAIVLALLPAFESLSQFSWFFGAGLGALIHYAIAERHAEHPDVSGEEIAVDSAHH
ncbi:MULTISPECIES: NCS1 family nucleobase:cation symporter-1 [unclassified Pseudomonas]|uniref:NCS1 family nucleobase:cation symporter-1 n=1 Tax=unclassified Pseudomonas TaxID=196821 RepID=UPI00129DBAEB|nr:MULTISPECIES: NCS1 family nucleobase:cation symporter-1 [unclassified Pseudomonas]MDH4653443.1 NCS1 family nucleobase:cation symporter-1 [Pseudomonas sp. BN606]MRK22326.1 NCS1 family nucleobase:cation symporter-1 [Pseudomonas sp. JG-B]